MKQQQTVWRATGSKDDGIHTPEALAKQARSFFASASGVWNLPIATSNREETVSCYLSAGAAGFRK
jgi:hypothetical protein